MQMILRWMRLSLTIIACLIFSACATNAPSVKPRLVEIWCSGDDGLTSRLRDSLESEFKSSPDIALSQGKKPGTLIVTIPTNVRWEDVGKRTKVFYAVEFASIDDNKLGVSTGSCWDDELDKCSTQIVKEAKVAADKIR